MASFERFYCLHFNNAELDYDFSWMLDVPPYAIPTLIHSPRYLCALEVGSGTIVDGENNTVLTPFSVKNDNHSYALILARLFGSPFDIGAFYRDIDSLAVDILKSSIDLDGCHITSIPERRPQKFGPCDVVVTNKYGKQAMLTFRNRGVWQTIRYFSPTLVLDPFGAIDPATAKSLIQFHLPPKEDEE